MAEILKWLQSYSPGVVLLLALGAALLYIMKLIVDRSIESSLKRRSTFEEKVLTERFSLITAFSSRFQKVMTNLNRVRSGHPVPDGFMKQNEIVPLTEIFEDLSVHRLVLGEEFHGLFLKQAQLMLRAANVSSKEDWNAISQEWGLTWEGIRREAEATFSISKIAW